jgi:hypothetical protein
MFFLVMKHWKQKKKKYIHVNDILFSKKKYIFMYPYHTHSHRDKKDKTQVLPTYEVFSMELHNKYNTYTYETEHAQ